MDSDGLYVISVVSRVLQMHPQTLRKYERAGLVQPSRSLGMLRLYSEDDVRRLRLIKHLVDKLGLNLAGVEIVLRLIAGLERVQGLARNGGPDSVGQIDRAIYELFETLEREEEPV